MTTPPARPAREPASSRTIAVDFGGSGVRVSVRDHGRDVVVGTVPVGALTEVLAPTAALLALAQDEAPATAAAVALPGTVDPGSGGILGINGKYAQLVGVDVVGWVSDRLSLPRTSVALANDARAALLGELHEGVADDAHDVVLVILGTGVGTAVAHDRRLLVGRHGHAGVLGGHLVIDYRGATCTCGQRGCAESLLGTWALPQTWHRVTGTPPPPLLGYRELLDLAAAGDPPATAVWQTLQRALTALLATLCHAHDPDVVVLSGGPLRHPLFDVDALQQRLHESLFVSAHRPALRVATQPELSVVKGLHHLATAREDL